MRIVAPSAIAILSSVAVAQVSGFDVDIRLSNIEQLRTTQVNEGRPSMTSTGRLDQGAGGRRIGLRPTFHANTVGAYNSNERFTSFDPGGSTDTILMETALRVSTDLPASESHFTARRAAASEQSVDFDVNEPVGYRVTGYLRTQFENPSGDVNAYLQCGVQFDDYAEAYAVTPHDAEFVFEDQGVFEPSPFYSPYIIAEIYIDTLTPDAVASATVEALLVIEFYEIGCSQADLTEPFGMLDITDVQAFLLAFAGMGPEADIALPVGVLDISDVLAFLEAYAGGCP